MIDTLITNGNVLTMCKQRQHFSNGAVAIHEGKIVEVGETTRLLDVYSANTTIDARGGIVMPGLVNGHCHAAMTLFRGYAENKPLDEFLECVWEAEGKYLDGEAVESAAFIACAEMVLSGITSFVDMYWYPGATIRAVKSIGLNLVTGPVFVNFPGLDDLPDWDARVSHLRRFADQYSSEEGIHLSIAPHSCYALNEDQLKVLNALAIELSLPIQIHASEAPSEMKTIDETYGASPIDVLHRTGLLERDCMIAHGVHLSDADIENIARLEARVVHCPISNAKTAAGTARIKDLRRAGVTVGLGTDGPSTGNDLDLWKVMRTASLMQSLKYEDPAALPNEAIVQMATCEGARAVGLDHVTGSLEPGKQADVIIISTDRPHMSPIYDPYGALVFAAGREDVEHVFIRGHHIVENGKLDCPEYENFSDQFDARTQTIQSDRSS